MSWAASKRFEKSVEESSIPNSFVDAYDAGLDRAVTKTANRVKGRADSSIIANLIKVAVNPLLD